MRKEVSYKLKEEVTFYQSGLIMGDWEKCIYHLGRAHVLSQSSVFSHLYTHWLMLSFSLKQKDLKEALAQILRLVVTVPGHLTGRVPMGNIGWSSVGLMEKLPVPADIEKVLGDQKGSDSSNGATQD